MSDVTIVVVPREQFSKTQRSLESVFTHTQAPYDLIYVDAGSPPPVRRYLEQRAAEKKFTLIRDERILPQNVARNLALPHIATKYAVFMDNDVLVTPRWLEPLVSCAEDTGCWVVGPLYCAGELDDPVIHTLGAHHDIHLEDGQPRWREKHLFVGRRLDEVRAKLQRRTIGLVEFHCLMARTDALARLGEFDPALLSFFDHNDFCLQVRAAGGAIYSEPDSVVSYLPPPPFEEYDLDFFRLRWSDHWIDSSAGHFAHKNGIARTASVFEGHYKYCRDHRTRLLEGAGQHS